MKVLRKFADKYGFSKGNFNGLGAKTFNKVFWRLSLSKKAVAYRKLSYYQEGRWDRDSPNNPKKVFFEWMDELVLDGKPEKALWWLREARKRGLDEGNDNVDIAREINSKIYQIIGGEVNDKIEKEIYEDIAAMRNAKTGVLRYIQKTRKSDLSDIPTFEETLGGLETGLARILSVFANIAIDLRRELPAFLFEENKDGLLNKYDEQQTPLDIVTNDIFRDASINSGFVRRYYSEEEKEVVNGLSGAKYTVTFDPLDGFSNIESNGPLGTIISVYEKDLEKDIVKGRDIVASMFILYGSSLAMLFAAKNVGSELGRLQKFVVYEMDDGNEKFLLQKNDVKIIGNPGFFGFGGKQSSWDNNFERFYDARMLDSKVRVHGCFVAELFEIATPKGSVFAYPANLNAPEGKLRFLIEELPAAALLFAGGGNGWNFNPNYDSILDVPITGENIDGRSPIIVGSREIIEKAKKIYEKKG